LIRNITDAVSWQIPAVQILQTKGFNLETGAKMAQIISGGDLILEVLKRTGIISHSVQGLLNWRNNVIWLLLCLSILDNYLSLHLQMLRFLSLLCFVFYNQTGICLLCILNRRQTNVYKPGAVQNGVLCEVDITTPELVTCYQNNRTIIYQSYSI